MAQQAGQAVAELQAYLAASQQELADVMAAPHVEEAEKAKFENEELRLRLADAISRATEAQRTLALSSGGAVESTEELGTTLDSNEQVGAMFGPREARGLGRGWPVLRVRPESWAERCGVQNGDELHRANGQPIEVLPEEEVMELLRQRPVELTWVRRSLRTSDPEASTPAAEPSDPEAVRPSLPLSNMARSVMFSVAGAEGVLGLEWGQGAQRRREGRGTEIANQACPRLLSATPPPLLPPPLRLL
ncbi:unnamed protein product [Polarella glacialis]|uniref:PDZ domain-containing protein n=1 Tax=Polarella glacialis TaxID=89957 RepID=A0A813KEF2_POLGL|nr:unnamed protein product [Polarella glacialis]